MSSVESPPCFNISAKGQLIFNLLLKVVEHFKLETQLRVAGGWVRDKLLGRDSYDIDIALDNMHGEEFCKLVNEYLISKGEKAIGVGVIRCNPDQSKHLETANMRLYDLSIDFVNLRTDVYTENSSIPAVRFGSPEEDAERRDLTINSLFYNLKTCLVEDWTKRGIADLRSGKIVTPLHPIVMFMDDPLRVLRAIRFAARFEFMLDDELIRAAKHEQVKSALASKISRERIGQEIDKIVSGNQPGKAVQHLLSLQLFRVVFNLPSEFDTCTSAESDSSGRSGIWGWWGLVYCYWDPAIALLKRISVYLDILRKNFGLRVDPPLSDRLCVANMDAAWGIIQLLGCSNFSDEQRRLALYSTLFLPLRNTTYKDKKSKKVPVVNYIFRSSLKLKVSDAETVISIHNATKKFISLIPSIILPHDENSVANQGIALELRVVAGLILRDIKEFWRVALLASSLLYPSEIRVTDLSADQLELEKRMEIFKAVERKILDLGLERVWEVKPLVDGKEIMKVLELKTGGPLVRQWQQKLLEWQLAHPSGTSEECVDWMRQADR